MEYNLYRVSKTVWSPLQKKKSILYIFPLTIPDIIKKNVKINLPPNFFFLLLLFLSIHRFPS